MLKKIVIAFLSATLVLALVGCAAKPAKTDSTGSSSAPKSDTSKAAESDGGIPTVRTDVNTEAADLETIVYDCWDADGSIVVVVKNNAKKAMSATISINCKDEQGNLVNDDFHGFNSSVAEISAGKESAVFFLNKAKPASIDYTVEGFVCEDDVKGIQESLTYKTDVVGENGILTVTNVGTEPIGYIDHITLFLKDNVVLNMSIGNIVSAMDDESYLQPGASASDFVNVFDEYDEVKMYLISDF